MMLTNERHEWNDNQGSQSKHNYNMRYNEDGIIIYSLYVQQLLNEAE